jgi:hypothetical protein
MPTVSRRPERKAKKSYTLSSESVAFLEVMRKRRRAVSVSSVLEDILQAVRRRQEQAKIEQSISQYYSSLSSKDSKELTDWAEFAEIEFPGGQ